MKRNLYLEKITPYIDQPIIKILVGLRRAGKSTIMNQLVDYLKTEKNIPENQILHANFETAPYLDIQTKDDLIKFVKNTVLKGNYRYLLFDEIQNIDDWDSIVNALHAENRFDIYLTGSNSKLLSRELSTLLTGRFINIRVDTLNFQEYLSFHNLSTTSADFNLTKSFQNYLDLGGFPAVHTSNYTTAEADVIVSDIYNSIVFRDLVERHNIRNTELFARVTSFIMDNIGNTFSAKSISDYLKNEQRALSVETIYNYLDWLEEAFIVERVSRFDIRGKAILKTNEKFFLGDIGLLYVVNGRKPSYLSGILENIVYHELISHGYSVTIGKNENQEVDFIAEKNHQKLYLQVSAHLNDQSTMDREFNALETIDDNYPKYVLTLDNNPDWMENRNGIEQKHLPDFILNSLD